MALDLAAARAQLRSDDEEARRAAVAELAVDARGADGARGLDLLVDAMGDTSWRVRKEAAARAAGWGDRAAAAEALTVALGEPDNVGRRNAAVEGLTAMGADAVAPIVAALAARPEHRKVLVDTLGLIGDGRAAGALEPLLVDADPNVRVATAESLGQLRGAGAGAAEAALRTALAHGKDRLLTLAALDGLNRLGARVAPSALEPLFAEPTLRAAAVEALGRSGDESAIERLERSLSDPARSTREAAIRALAELCRRADVPLRARLRGRLSLSTGGMQSLVQALMEGTLGVQRAAVTVLGFQGRAEAVRPLVLAVADAELRDAAIDALVTIGAAAVEVLVTLAPDLEGRLRGDVFRLLPRLGPAAAEPRVQTLLAEALGDEDLDAAAGAAHALGEVGGQEALAPLVRACTRTGRADEVAAAAAQALGQLGTRHYDAVRILVQSRGLDGPEAPHLCRVLGACGRASDVSFLRTALGASSSDVRRAAAEALAQLPATGEADDALLFALADESVEVRAAAARALGAHASENPGRVIDPLERAAYDGEVAVRGAAARALGAVARAAAGGERSRALAVLRKLADAPEVIAAVPALEALGLIGDPADDPRLIAALDSADAEIVKVSARALGRRPPVSPEDPRGRAAREALDRALSDRRWDVRRAAAQALGEHGASAHPLLYARRTVERDALVLEAIDAALGAALDGARATE